jgi:hypothetical protein
MQIVISPKVRKILTIILVGVLLLVGFLAIFPARTSTPPTSHLGTSSDAQAAANALIAFYTLDSTEDIEAWTARVCAASTEAGCRAVRDYFAPEIQGMVSKHQIQTGCEAEPVRLISDTGHKRVWQVHVTLDHPWDGLDLPSQDVYVELSQENGKWLMNRLLFEQEVQSLVTPTP